jgi:hypothetical protein
MTLLVSFATVVGLSGCSTPSAQRFDTADNAVNTLVSALRSDNVDDLHRILGPDADDLLDSGDSVADTNGRKEFLKLYDEKHTLKPDGEDSMTLEIGSTAWPLPIPVTKDEKGWYFDTATGLDEMLSRRIGRNELSAIQVCLAICDAEKEYASADLDGNGWREYAQKFNSDPGMKNGLYWPPVQGQPDSPLGELVAEATSQGYLPRPDGVEGPRPYHGYYYRVLTAQGDDAPGGAMSYIVQGHMIGGFAVIAWPAEYANSGLKSFMISHHGIVYEKDLGDDTDKIARAMKEYNPGAGWTAADSTPRL